MRVDIIFESNYHLIPVDNRILLLILSEHLFLFLTLILQPV